MSEKQNESWFDAISQLKKVNPFAFGLAFGMMLLVNHLLRSAQPLEEKIAPLLLAFFFAVATLCYEAYRIEKERDQKEQIWRRKVLG